MTKPRVIVVAKRTPYRHFIEEQADPRARALLSKRDPSVGNWRASHRAHMKTIDEVERALDAAGAQTLVLHRAHAAFDTSDAMLVIAVGGDGTLLAASHNVGSVPILGVNSAPGHSVGFFCAADLDSFRGHLERALADKLPKVQLTRMSVYLNGSIRTRRVLNEVLFSHSSPAATSRYILRFGPRKEEHRSSGFWIGPAAGSTAAQRSAGGRVLPLNSTKLQLVVREPYVPHGKRYELLRQIVPEGQKLSAQSMMDDASLYLDGPHRQINVRLGDVVAFAASDEPLTLLGLRSRRKA